MAPRENLKNSEVAIIGRGVEGVLRRLIRFLAGTISLTKLHDIVNRIYVEEMDEKLRKERPDRQVTLSTLALNTGLDTRVINRIQSSPAYKRGITDDTEFFRDFTPAARLLHLWSADERFTDPDTGLPRVLSMSGKQGSLEQLATLLKLPRGVTVKSVADQLERSGLVRYDKRQDRLEMRMDRYLPSPDKDREGALEIGFVAVGRLMDTVLGNLEPARPSEERLYQRIYWIQNLPPGRRQAFRDLMVDLMREVERVGCRELSAMEQPFETPGQISAGFGLYLFEDPEEPSSK